MVQWPFHLVIFQILYSLPKPSIQTQSASSFNKVVFFYCWYSPSPPYLWTYNCLYKTGHITALFLKLHYFRKYFAPTPYPCIPYPIHMSKCLNDATPMYIYTMQPLYATPMYTLYSQCVHDWSCKLVSYAFRALFNSYYKARLITL